MCEFTYYKSDDLYIDSRTKNISRIYFDISRYGKYNYYIDFDHKVSELEAIKTVENFLSGKITKEYYDQIKDDLLNDDLTFEELESHGYECRGDLLSSCTFLEDIQHLEDGVISISCGS